MYVGTPEELKMLSPTRSQVRLDNPQKHIWRSCCIEVDSRAVLFFSQLVITSSVMAFCIYILATRGDCETQKWYGGTLMFLIGIHLPAPKITSG